MTAVPAVRRKRGRPLSSSARIAAISARLHAAKIPPHPPHVCSECEIPKAEGVRLGDGCGSCFARRGGPAPLPPKESHP